MRWRQFCAELLAACDDLGGELVVTLGRPARRHPAHPADPGDRHGDRARPRRPAQARAVDVRGPDRHRRRVPGRLRAARRPRRVLLGGGAPLRRPAAVPEGDAGAARPDRGAARGAASRSATCPEDARAWERGVDELAEEDEDVADYVRALEETRDTTELPEARGEAIAREFERYLKRRDRGRLRPARREPRRGRSASVERTAPQSSRPSAASRPSERMDRAGLRVAGVGQSVRCRASPSTQASTAATARRGVEVVGQGGRGRRRPPARPAAPAPSASARRHAVEPCRPTSQSSASVHSQSAAVVVAQQGQPDRHRVDLAVAQRPRRRPGCPCDFDIFSPS